MNRKSSRNTLCQHIIDIVEDVSYRWIFEILSLVYNFILKMLEANFTQTITSVSRI